jgi:sn-glycerol 3-phosphate transport system permease protein
MTPRRCWDPYWMLAPTLGFLVVFFAYPLIVAAWLSLHDWDLLTPPVWVGGENYRELVASGELARLFLSTGTFSAVVVVASMLLGLCLALALNRPGRFPAFVRSSIFSAYVVSWVSVGLLWLWVLDTDAGVLTALLRTVGLSPVRWLSDPSLALYSLAGVTVWKITGYALVIFLAGLQQIPDNLHEAAQLDGASSWAAFRRITWPLLRPTAAFVATTSLIVSFQAFDVVRVMTQGGPVHSTTIFVYAIYEHVFLNLRVGRASALVMVFFGVLLLLTGLELWLWQRRPVR